MKTILKLIRILISFTFIDTIHNALIIKLNRVSIGENNTFKGQVNLSNKGEMAIGNNCRINSGKRFNSIGGDIITNLFVGEKGKLTMGSYIGMSNSTIFCNYSITIEDMVMFGGSCKVYDSDFHSIDMEERMDAFKRYAYDEHAKTAAVVIKRGAWIGGHCIILKGVTIGENAVIGAGSVVVKDVPSDEIWAGNPAKFIRKI